jgi:hypothetical protein
VASVVVGSSPIIHPIKDQKTGQHQLPGFFVGIFLKVVGILSFFLQFFLTLNNMATPIGLSMDDGELNG